MMAIFMMNAFGVLGRHPEFASAMPVSSWIAHGLAGLGMSDAATRTSPFLEMDSHADCSGICGLYPESKHLHIVAAGPNTFFKSLVAKRHEAHQFRGRSVQQYGAAKVTD